MAAFKHGSAPDLRLTGVQVVSMVGKKGGRSRPSSAAFDKGRSPNNGFQYEYSVVESLPQTHDSQGWPIGQKDKRSYTPVIGGRSRANSAGTVKSFHSEPMAPRSNKTALLRQRLNAIQKQQENTKASPVNKKTNQTRIVSASRRKPVKSSNEHSQRSNKSDGYVADADRTDHHVISENAYHKNPLPNRRSNGNVYSFLGEAEPAQPKSDRSLKQQPSLKLNLGLLNDSTPRDISPVDKPETTNADKIPKFDNTNRRIQALDELFDSSKQSDQRVGNSSVKPPSVGRKPNPDDHAVHGEEPADHLDSGDEVHVIQKPIVKHNSDDDLHTDSGDDLHIQQKSPNHDDHMLNVHSDSEEHDLPLKPKLHAGHMLNGHSNSEDHDLHVKPKSQIHDDHMISHHLDDSQDMVHQMSHDESDDHHDNVEQPSKKSRPNIDLPSAQKSTLPSAEHESVDESRDKDSRDHRPITPSTPTKPPGRPPSSHRRRSARLSGRLIQSQQVVNTPPLDAPNLDEIFDQKPRRMASFSTQEGDNSDQSLPHQRDVANGQPAVGQSSTSPPVVGMHSFRHFAAGGANAGFHGNVIDSDRSTSRPPLPVKPVPANRNSLFRNSTPPEENGTPDASVVEDLDDESFGEDDFDASPSPTNQHQPHVDDVLEDRNLPFKRNKNDNTVIPASPKLPNISKTVPEVIDEKYSTSIKDYLHKVNSIDNERRNEINNVIMSSRSIQLSNDTPPVKSENKQSTGDSLLYLVQEMINEKRELTTLCAKLLEQMQITTSKLVEIESRQEKSLLTLIGRNNGVTKFDGVDNEKHETKIDLTVGVEPKIDWKCKYEEFVDFHSQEITNIRLKHDEEIKSLKNQLDSTSANLRDEAQSSPERVEFSCQTELFENDELHSRNSTLDLVEISVQTDDIVAHFDNSLGEDNDLERTVNGILSDNDSVKNRLLNVSEEKTQLESLLGEKNTEIERLKSELTQVVDEQAEFASQLSSKLTNRIEDLQSENSTLKQQLEGLERRCNELASVLNSNLSQGKEESLPTNHSVET